MAQTIFNFGKIAVGFAVVMWFTGLFISLFGMLYQIVKYFIDYFCIIWISGEARTYTVYLFTGFLLIYVWYWAWWFFDT